MTGLASGLPAAVVPGLLVRPPGTALALRLVSSKQCFGPVTGLRITSRHRHWASPWELVTEDQNTLTFGLIRIQVPLRVLFGNTASSCLAGRGLGSRLTGPGSQSMERCTRTLPCVRSALHRALSGLTQGVYNHLLHCLMSWRNWKNSQILTLGWNSLSWDSRCEISYCREVQLASDSPGTGGLGGAARCQVRSTLDGVSTAGALVRGTRSEKGGGVQPARGHTDSHPYSPPSLVGGSLLPLWPGL